ncbi:hypothetical protein E3N88_22828 [Mikania micrantha]|uniref:SWIM-type domain-containing protein n=1 Tax=Mikania micrantha TaxID=192012 RepID=A0A5N6ND85_9ASTR|nr:hypothetical protein E3N88_22828 [Mikania micrantha]
MSSFRPFLVKLYWNGETCYVNGVVNYDESTLSTSFIMRYRMTYEQFVDEICKHIQIQKESSILNLLLYYSFQSISESSYLVSEESMNMLYFLAENELHFMAHIKVKWQTTFSLQQTSCMDLLRGFSGPFEVGVDHTTVMQENDHCESDGFEHSEGHMTIESEESEFPPSNDESENDDAVPESWDRYNFGVHQGFSQATFDLNVEAEELNDYGLPDFDEEEDMDIWNEDSNELRLGMYFNSKNDVIYAVRRWNVSCNREIYVADSKPSLWKARCKTAQPQRDSAPVINTPLCRWRVTASKRRNHHLWRITTWTSWIARRLAIEKIHGSWESNFEELPRYVEALKSSNDGTVVNWFHHPHSTQECAVFKFVFWAFGPCIKAFHLCQPIISVDGTHLKGPYKGKLLIDVSKNANNYILPVAYAIVDEETNESWSWFFQQFHQHVRNNSMGKLCVISDRHKGIVNVMENDEDWMEPKAYHRYCLRHIRSNFMINFKSVSLKKLCWAIGSTTQRRKYRFAKREIRGLNEEAWQYLNNIEKSKWTVVFDERRRRWGNLTTNISESLNNVLRGARLLPIKACIDFTFQRDVAQYVKHTEIATSCTTALPPRMVISRLQTNEDGGNDYTVEYRKKTCTCGKWQIYRFPCSHAIAVCHWRGDQPHDFVNYRFHTATYRAQYDGHFYPLSHSDHWREADWRIRGDTSRITVLRGRRRARRIHNEMDVHYPEERRTRLCGLCRQPGHTINRCPNRQQ